MNSLKDVSKWGQFYKAALKENFNNHAKIPIAPILNRGTTREAYLEPSRISAMELFYKNYQRLEAVNNFQKNASSQMFGRILNTSMNSERVL